MRFFVALMLVLLSRVIFAEVAPLNEQDHAPLDEGIRFSCQPDRMKNIESGMKAYLNSLGIAPQLIVKKINKNNGIVVYTLNTPADDTNTLNLHDREEFAVKDVELRLPARRGQFRIVQTVSKKEIVLALLQHGRLTEFKGDACDVQALVDHVGIRQNIAAWSENLNWIWPDGQDAQWNKKFWRFGTPKSGIPLNAAVNDVFFDQSKYSFGCYTATKILIIQGIIDYYRRVRPNLAQLKIIERRLFADHDPLVDVEPGKMWDFEADYDKRQLDRPGKLLKVIYGVAPDNIVPGDWIYLVNTDPASRQKTGYEGSNPIYLGRNKFADYYNDNDHGYTFRQKIDEVYQWRNGVFSRSRDFARIKPLMTGDLERLSETPAMGGLLIDMRVFPCFFGYEPLPALHRK